MAEVDHEPRPLRAPSLSPDCIWETMPADPPVTKLNWKLCSRRQSVPKAALFHSVKLEEDDVYIGRVDAGTAFYIGTAIPKRNVCIYLDKNLEVKSSSDYEILTVPKGFGAPLHFVDPTSEEKEKNDLFPAGIDEKEEILYVGRYVDANGNTYYGWMYEDLKKLFIPRDPNRGPQVVEKDFAVLMHIGIHLMCRGCPTPLDYSGYN